MTTKVSANSKGIQLDSDVHVTYEDQSKINTFAKHNAKLNDFKEELQNKKNDLQNLEEAAEEITLFDDDEQIPFAIGEVFISNNLAKTQELLAENKTKIELQIKEIEENCRKVQNKMNELKAQLYHRFGSNIYLENDE